MPETSDRYFISFLVVFIVCLFLAFAYLAPQIPTELGTFKKPYQNERFDVPVTIDYSSGQPMITYSVQADSLGRIHVEPIGSLSLLTMDVSPLIRAVDPFIRWYAGQALQFRVLLAILIIILYGGMILIVEHLDKQATTKQATQA